MKIYWRSHNSKQRLILSLGVNSPHVEPGRVRLGCSMIASAGLHCASVALLFAIVPFAKANRDVVPVELIRREPLVYRMPSPVHLQAPAVRASKRKAPKKAPDKAKRSSAEAPSPPRMATRAFQLPLEHRATQSEQTILLPQAPIERRQVLVTERLPNVTFWSTPDRPAPPPAKKFIAPGRRTEPGPPPELIAPPVLQSPNRESTITDLKLANMPAAADARALVREAGTTMPMQSVAGTARTSRDASLDLQRGDPATVITANSKPAPARETITIPAVNQLGKLPAVATSSGDGSESASAGAGGNASGAAGRIVHPANGVFDIVVQSSASDGSDDAKLLPGKPVYTVYLKVGTPKEWILRYCAGKSASKQSGMVVKLTPPAPLEAPYPRMTVAPPIDKLARRARTVLHGFVTAAGRFRDLAAVKPDDAEYWTRIGDYLRQWEFRPASRDGQPVEIEVLLVIPPQGL